MCACMVWLCGMTGEAAARCAGASALCVLLALATGCSSCDGAGLLAAAKQKKLSAVHELGELGDPRVPSSAGPIPNQALALQTLRPLLASGDRYTQLLALEACRHLGTRARSKVRDRFPDLLDPLLKASDP